MQMNCESTAIVQGVIGLPASEHKHRCQMSRKLLSALGQPQLVTGEKIENALWTVLVLCAIWALVVSISF
jgi:hypothetical protein